jgi:hypothetical protein
MPGGALDVIAQIGAGTQQQAAAENQEQQTIPEMSAVFTIILPDHSILLMRSFSYDGVQKEHEAAPSISSRAYCVNYLFLRTKKPSDDYRRLISKIIST